MPDGSDLKRKLGMTRRQLLRRGAIVGGTLIWTIPVLNSLKPEAFGQPSSPARFFCCFCKKPKKPSGFSQKCINPFPGNTAAQCAQACKKQGNYPISEFHSGPRPFSCKEKTGCVAK
jgi:hypothetical protein